jgi:hypothetical protein
VAIGIFAFEIWFAERILLTFIGHQGREVGKSMINEMNLERVRDHFIICGYRQVGRTVIEELNRAQIPHVLIETNGGAIVSCSTKALWSFTEMPNATSSSRKLASLAPAACMW